MEDGHEVIGKNIDDFVPGQRSKIPGIIDDASDVFFDPAYTIDSNGRIRITEISLCRRIDI